MKIKERERREREIENERNLFFEKVRIEKEEERRLYLENCEKKMYSQSDAAKSVNKALKLTEVCHGNNISSESTIKLYNLM